MRIKFPNNPKAGDYIKLRGNIYRFDGKKWISTNYIPG